MSLIYHITTRHAWETAQQSGFYSTLSLELEGFIHFSTRDQVRRVGESFYKNMPDLVLLTVDTDKLQAELRWEAPIHPNPTQAPSTETQELFPHVYGAIHIHEVVAVEEFEA